MSSRFVRSSKYRHVFGRPTRKEQCYDNLHISKNAWDSNIVKANPKYISVNWEASGGGAFAVIPVSVRGKLPDQLPLFRGHTAAVLDTDWNPFNDEIVASGSDDGKVFIWKVPANFSVHVDEEDVSTRDVSPELRLSGHGKKVGHVLFHPSAENTLATSSGDFTVKLWDIEAGQAKLTLPHPEIVQSMTYNAQGSLLVTTNRDKKLRVWDLRQQAPAYEGPGHAGAKNSRAVWLGEMDRIATAGFSRMSDRQLGLWDIRSPAEPIGGFQLLDSISGVLMPFWDDGTKCLYLAGKGDGNIRYYEYVNDDLVYLSEYKSADPQRGVAFVPKRGVDVKENEVMRAYKTVGDSYIEPISFIVPRRAESFQSDIYPEAASGKPGLSAAEWFGGKDALPPTFDLGVLYSDDYVPAPSAAPVPKPEPVVSRAAPAPAKQEPAPAPTPVKKDPIPEITFTQPEETAKPSKKTTETEEVVNPVPVAESPREKSAPAPSSSGAESGPHPQSALIGSQLVSHLSSLQDLYQSLSNQARTIENQKSQVSTMIKEIEALKQKLN